MYKFHWVPANSSRHASTDERPEGALVYPSGTAVTTLCGKVDQVADNTEIAWLWATCPECYEAALRMARAADG
ncbi:zinc finger protein [Saccharopolyspora sp. NPDC049357]|uniref:zinc finger protein n=1 Tax=Saccharopolyspora sp. NPDC049357 TaxID=3154507 RepID=UPI003448A390